MRRGACSGIAIVGAAAYAAALLVFGLPGLGGANHTVSVATEQEYRDALTDLSAGDTAPHTINVTADITIDDGTDPTYSGTQPLTINGNGHTLDATNSSRVLNHNSAAALTIEGLTVTAGAAAGGNGGGILALGSVTVTNGTVTGNTSDGGGGILALGSVTVTNSTVSGNMARFSGGGILAGGSVTVTNGTVSSNTATQGGGIQASSGSVTVTNSTVTGNTASGGGGGIQAFGLLQLIYATVVENSAPLGANVRGDGTGLTSFGSVVALPQGGGANCTMIGGTTSNGYNYDDDGSCGFGGGTGDTSDGPDPQLGPLASNGGPTRTRLPLVGSPLIDAIPEDDCDEAVTDDQRDVDRPQDGDDDGTLACDIGAVEVIPGENQPGAGPAEPVAGDPSFTG